MKLQRFKVALNAARMPLVSSRAQRAVFVPGLDSAPRTPRVFMGADESIDYNIPQLVYCENVMPVSEGVRSVGYKEFTPAFGGTSFDAAYPLRDPNEETTILSPAGGENYVLDRTTNTWAAQPLETVYAKTLHASCDPSTAAVTYAYLEGVTIICYARMKSNDGSPVDMSLVWWDGTNLNPGSAYLVNLPFGVGEIDGIGASNGYLLVYSGISVAWARWNAATNTFDFDIYANGDFTGSGFAIPEDLKGNITALIPVPAGFLLFTDNNCVGATFHSGSIATPYVFREVANAGGVESFEQCTVEGSLGNVFALTTAGLQQISINSAEVAAPDLSDFISGRAIEYWNSDTASLELANSMRDMLTKVTNIGNRYIVISVGFIPGIFTFALVYDLQLKRWGKLRITHRDCFYFRFGRQWQMYTYGDAYDVSYDYFSAITYDTSGGETDRAVRAPHGMAFLKQDGQIVIADWSEELRDAQDEGVVVIGRMQLSRQAGMQLSKIEVEGIKSGNVYVQPSYDGRNLAASQQAAEVSRSGDYGDYAMLVDCKNLNVVVQGTFALSTVILEARPSGSMM